MNYIARRLLHAVLLLVAVSFCAFAFSEWAPGDYFTEMANDPRISPATIEHLRQASGAGRPFAVRYASWLGATLHGDFGYSVLYAAPVGPLLAPRIRATLLLALTATLVAWLLAIPIGIGLAVYRATWIDTAAKVMIALLLSVPELLIAIVLLVFAVESGKFPAGGMSTPGSENFAGVLWHLVLPATALIIGMLPVLVRHVRAAMVEVLDAPFALNARAQGIDGARLLVHHLLPAAANPLISLFGLSMGSLLSAGLLVEIVMGWPGLGPFFLEAIMARDYSIVLAVVMLSTLFLTLFNLAADLVLYRLDPRIRIQ